jgi:hypothetical protein
LDQETARIILKWDGESDLEDHLECFFFQFKKEFILLTHPKLIKKKLILLERSIDAVVYLTGDVFSKKEVKLEFGESHSFFLEYYTQKEAEKSDLKLSIQSTDDLSELYAFCLKYEASYLNWHQTLANIQLMDLDYTDVKQSTNVNPMDLYNDIKSWSEHNFAPELIQKTNFVVLYNEICRSKIILEQL